MLIFFLAAFLAGLYSVVKGASIVVGNSAALARHFGVSNLIIGLSVVAFGTSIPELTINIFSRVDISSIGIGNAIGASIANMAFIIGLASIMAPVHVNVHAIRKQLPLVVVGISLLILVVGDVFGGSGEITFISRNEGIILLIFFGFFIYNLFYQAIKEHKVFEDHKETAIRETAQTIVKRVASHDESEKKQIFHYVGFLVLGLAMMIVGAYFVVEGGKIIALTMGLSETFIGLLFVSLATTTPELATALAAVKQGQPDIAVGNAIGSSLFNLLAIVGIAAIITPVGFEARLIFDMLVLLGFVLHFFTVAETGRKITRKEGITLVFFYILYAVIISVRG
ncbi:sodium:calcium antiporter [Candidatus Parcubacteria bacterium]|nr:MAG: sodium:calcium antiporter [Candidatus Parcubacteria bacterium]